MSEQFIFICGAPRSGTTLLANLLDGHKRIAQFPNGETHILQHWFRLPDHEARIRFFLRDYLNSEEVLLLTDTVAARQYDQQVQRAHGNENVFSSRCANRETFVQEYLASLRGQEFSLGAVYRSLLRATLLARGENHENRLRLERRPLDNEIAAPVLAQEFPDARFIHVVRDPRSRYLSAKMRRILRLHGVPLFARNLHGLDFATVHATVSMTSLTLAKLNQEIIPERYLLVRHEDLTSSPEQEMHRISRFLNIDFHEGLLHPSSGGQNATPMSSVSRDLAHKACVHDLDSQRLRQFESATSASERRILEFITWQAANFFGYNVPRRDRLSRRDLLSPLKYEHPASYYGNRVRMFDEIRGPGIYVLPRLYQDCIDRFFAGTPMHD